MNRTWALYLGMVLVSGCASPVVSLVEPTNVNVHGVRVRQYVPYEVFVYVVDESGKVVLKQRTIENLPHPTNLYAINYTGALVSSSKFKITFNENGGLSGVYVETLRTLKEAAEAAQSLNDQVLKMRKAEQDAKKEDQAKKDVLDRLKAIKDFRDVYKAATDLPAAPGEPTLPDGAAIPGAK